MGAIKQVFRKNTSERDRRRFYKLCDECGIEQAMLEPATTSNGGERVGSTIYLETDEHTELTELVAYFGLTKSGLTRTCYRLGAALITEALEDTPLDGEEEV